jgi:ATP diphosphatase
MLKQTERLLDIMAQLRDPETGCAWDLQQDFQSLAPYTLEEAYEVVDAIERKDFDDLRGELGDLLLQIVFHAQLAKEQQLFDFEQVAKAISDKLIRRHPHVFAGQSFADDEQRQHAWEQAKAEERQQKQAPEEESSVLDGIATALPALTHCEKIQDRAAHYGFDWPEADPVFEKVLEELDEVKEAWISGNRPHIEEEIGDLLLVTVNLARHLKVNPEMALRRASAKFSKRFQYIEQQLKAAGRDWEECQLAELDALWDEAKQQLKS